MCGVNNINVKCIVLYVKLTIIVYGIVTILSKNPIHCDKYRYIQICLSQNKPIILKFNFELILTNT